MTGLRADATIAWAIARKDARAELRGRQATVSTLFLYAVVALAAWKQPLPGFARLVVGVAFLFALWTFYGAGLEAFLWGLALLAAGWPIRWLSRRLNSSAAIPLAAAPAVPPGSAA